MHSRWEQDTMDLSIEYKELFPILVACATWGHMWCRLRIAFHCDSQAVVDCLALGTSKSPPVMALVRKLFFVCARHNFCVVARHVPGKSNAIADALSRFKLQEFRMLAPPPHTPPNRGRIHQCPFPPGTKQQNNSMCVPCHCTIYQGSIPSWRTTLPAVLPVMPMGPVAGDRQYVIELCGLLGEICEPRYSGQLHLGRS